MGSTQSTWGVLSELPARQHGRHQGGKPVKTRPQASWQGQGKGKEQRCLKSKNDDEIEGFVKNMFE